MKTTAQRIVGMATIALFSLSLNAQNTKSVHFVNYTPEASIYVSKKMERISQKLSEQVQRLAMWVKFVPGEINEGVYTEANFDFLGITEQLSREIKYVPSSDLNITNEEINEEINFDSILEELKPTVKYSPSEEVSEDSVFDRITAELEKTVRFYPAANI